MTTMIENNKGNSNLNVPLQAAMVFRDVVVREVVEENHKLQTAVAPLKAFRDNLETVKLRYRRGKGNDSEEVLIAIKLNEGAMEGKDGAVWKVPIRQAVSIPLGGLQGLDVLLSDVKVGTATGAMFGGPSQLPKVEMDKADGTIRLEVSYSKEVSIAGQIETVGYDADRALVANMIERNEFQAALGCGALMGHFNFDPVLVGILQNATFTPQSVKLKVSGSSTIQHALDISLASGVAVAQADPMMVGTDDDSNNAVPPDEQNSSTTGSTQLRQLVSTVFGDAETRQAVEENLQLKAEQKSLEAARDLLLTVELRHDTVSLHFNLDEGSLDESSNDPTNPCWEINMVDMDLSIPVDCLCRVRFSLSGVPTGSPSGPVYEAPPQIFVDVGEGALYMTLSYSSILTLTGRFDLNPFIDDDTMDEELLRGMEARIWSSLRGVAKFPGVKFQLCRIKLQLSGIQDSLKEVLGIRVPEPAVESTGKKIRVE